MNAILPKVHINGIPFKFSHAGPVAEQVLLLDNIGTSVLVGPDQLSSLHKLLLTAASTLQMDPPDLYIKQVLLSAQKLLT